MADETKATPTTVPAAPAAPAVKTEVKVDGKKYKYKGRRDRMFGKKPLKIGDVITLTPKQAKAWSDLFEPV